MTGTVLAAIRAAERRRPDARVLEPQPSEIAGMGRPGEVAAVLRVAAHICTRNWVQHTSSTADGRMCQGMAIHVAAHRHNPADAVSAQAVADLAHAALRRHLGEHPERWNDTPGRTAQQVVAALRAAAEDVAGAATEGEGTGEAPTPVLAAPAATTPP